MSISSECVDASQNLSREYLGQAFRGDDDRESSDKII